MVVAVCRICLCKFFMSCIVKLPMSFGSIKTDGFSVLGEKKVSCQYYYHMECWDSDFFLFILAFCVLVMFDLCLCCSCVEFFVASAMGMSLVWFVSGAAACSICPYLCSGSRKQLSLGMTSKQSDIRLIPEFSVAATNLPIVEGLENVELICELCDLWEGTKGWYRPCQVSSGNCYCDRRFFCGI